MYSIQLIFSNVFDLQLAEPGHAELMRVWVTLAVLTHSPSLVCMGQKSGKWIYFVCG